MSVLTVDVAVLALDPTMVARHRTVDQHPAGVLLALLQAGPGGAVLVTVLAAGLHPGLAGGLGRGLHGDGAPSHLGFAGTLVQSVDLPDVRVGEALSLANLTLGGVLRDYRLLTPGLNTDVTLFPWKSFCFWGMVPLTRP